MSNHRHVLKPTKNKDAYRCMACPLEYSIQEVEHLVNVNKYDYVGTKLNPDKNTVFEKLDTDRR